MLDNKTVKQDLDRIINEPVKWDKLKNKTVLITGVNGMIASYLAYTLLHLNDTQDFHIKLVGMVRNEEKARKRFQGLLEREDFELLVQDVCDSMSYEPKVDFIIHAASQTGPRQFIEDPIGTINANTLGTKNLLDFAAVKKVECFLFLSTREIYGKCPGDQQFVSETEYGAMDPTLVRSCYPESKRMSETMCAAYQEQYNVPCKIVRIAHTYGPGILIGDGRVIGDFLNNVISKENIKMNSDGSTVLALTYLSDTAGGIFYSMLNFENFVYNISNDKESITVKELAIKLCELYKDRGITAEFAKSDAQTKAGYLNYAIPLLSSKAAEAEGWNPRVNLDEGMRRTIEYIEHERFWKDR